MESTSVFSNVKQPIPVIARSEATKQSSFLDRSQKEAGLLRFARNDVDGHAPSFSRLDFARVVAFRCPSSEERAQGKPGADCARRSRAPEHTGIPCTEAHGHALQVQPRHPDFPRAMAL